MRKIILLLSLLIFIEIPTVALATSGACSSHGGVYCMLGASYDGSVTCNDFTSDSAVYYWDTVECGGTVTQILSNCPATGNLETQINDLVSQFYNSQSEELQKELNLSSEGISQNAINGRKIELRRNLGIELSSIYKDIVSKCQTALTQQVNEEATAQQNQTNQQNRCPANATLTSDNRCKCNDGYAIFGNTCITYNQICQNHYGSNSHNDGAKCYCNAGYQWNSSRTLCVEKPAPVSVNCPSNSFNSDGQCKCNFGYILQNSFCVNHTTICKNQFGEDSYGDGTNCSCNAGAQWNASKTACIKITILEQVKNIETVDKQAKNTETLDKMETPAQINNTETIKQDNLTENTNQEIKPTENNTQENKTIIQSISGVIKNIFKSIDNFFSKIFR